MGTVARQQLLHNLWKIASNTQPGRRNEKAGEKKRNKTNETEDDGKKQNASWMPADSSDLELRGVGTEGRHEESRLLGIPAKFHVRGIIGQTRQRRREQ